MLNRIVRTVGKIIGISLPHLQDIYTEHCVRRADGQEKTHFIPQIACLPSGRRYRSRGTRTTQLLNSFFPHSDQTDEPECVNCTKRPLIAFMVKILFSDFFFYLLLFWSIFIYFNLSTHSCINSFYCAVFMVNVNHKNDNKHYVLHLQNHA